jgi:Flp pilus assembly protein TadD
MPTHQDQKPPGLWQIAGIRPLWVILGLLIILALIFGRGWGSKKYELEQQKHLLAQAKEFDAKGDYRSEILTLRRVLQLNPENVEAVRMLALQADRFNSPASLQWMHRLADLEPGNLTNLVMWARSALRQGELIAADQVLQRFAKAQQDSLDYHRLAGALAIQIRNYQAAEYHFAKALKLNPDGSQEQLNLASIRLLSAQPQIVRDSRATLEKLTSDPTLGREAAMALLADYLRQKNVTKQLELALKITEMPGSRFTDRLMYLDLLRKSKDKRFTTELAATKEIARKENLNASELVAWMNSRGLSQEAYDWVATLPDKDRISPAMGLAYAESLTQLKKWEELLPLATKSNWQELDFLRLAFQARAQREMNLWGSSRSSWRQAMASVGIDPHSRSLLAKLAQGWEWNSEAEEIWWVLARGETGRIPALKALHRIYHDTGDSRSLLRVTVMINELLPEDPVIMNNYAMLSLLLGQNLPKAKELAHMNYKQHPDDPAAISTYAFSLREEGKLNEALAVMDKLSPEVKKIPAMAAFWGILLTEAGRVNEARPFLELGRKAEDSLPEEKELLKAALAKAAK